MRVLFVTAAFLPDSIGGVELHVHGIARALIAQGHEVEVFCRGADSTRPEFAIERYCAGDVPVTRINYLFSDCDGFPRLYRNPSIRALFAAELQRFKPDVVHAHHLTCLSTDLLDAAKDARARVVMTLHDFWMGCPRGQRMTPQLELCADVVVEKCSSCLHAMWSGWFKGGAHASDLALLSDYHSWIRGLLLRADRLVTPSETSRAVFHRYGIPRSRITVVENGLDAAPFRALARTPSASNGLRVGFVGSVLPTKGVHVLIEAFSRLDAPGATLSIHGAETGWHEVVDYPQRLRALAAPLDGRVSFHGRYEQNALPGILAGMDVLVVPSLWYEAFCLTLREAWLAGVVVVASRLGAMAEGVEDGVTGLLFEPGNADELSRVLARLASDRELRERLVRAPKRVRTVEENAADLMNVYLSGAGGAGA